MFKWGLEKMAAIRLLVGIMIFMGIVSSELLADKIILKHKQEGNNVKVIGEGTSTFTVEIPKDEIETIEGESFNEVTLWKEKKILWEDQGDYIAVFLPKERITAPESTKEEGSIYYGKQEEDAFTQAITSTGAGPADQQGSVSSFYPKGNIQGKVTDKTGPVVNCRIKIAYLKGQSDVLTRVLSGDTASGGEEINFETTTNKYGIYEFKAVPVGNYDLYWIPPGGTSWVRKLSEKPSVAVLPGKTVHYEEIKVK